jgi:DNA-binding response OmpR family regulator/DNA-binding CsgD family transcriptional regulator
MIGSTTRPASATTRDTILVIDDNPESLRFIVDALEDHAMTVLIAKSGEAALELLGHTAPDLILMDGMMPGLSGLETTRRIKRNPAHAHIPVIFMTGMTEPEHVVAALDTGGVDYVRKPIVIDELIARIRVHLANARRSYRSHLALGRAGRSLVALAADGALAWCTPQAEALFKQIEPAWDENSARLPAAIEPAVLQLLRDTDGRSAVKLDVGGVNVEVALSESDQPAEMLVKITEIGEASKVRLIEARSGLTHREAEVLLWVSYGKTNRTISEILGISPRTVNKHLEQIFKKLGVETRAGATALAVRIMEE